MSSSSTQKQQQRRRINNSNIQQSRNTNAYFDREEYHRRSLINNKNYWNHDYYMDDYYQHQNTYPLSSQRIRKSRQTKQSSSSSNNNHSYYDNIPPRHRLQQQRSFRTQELRMNNKSDEINQINTSTNDEQPTKPLQSASSSSTNSDVSNTAGATNRKDLHTKNLAAAAIAARQQNSQPQTNLNVVQTLMNSLILQQQQQQQPSQSQSTIQLQYQLTNALLATMIQQRLKEAALQAQAQQIQAALPTLLAAQALVYQQQQQQQQQQGPLPATQQQAQTIPPANVAHPGTKFNNRPLVKYPVIRPTMPPLSSATMMPVIRPTITTNLSRHRLGTNTQQVYSTTTLPTYQQVQEIERGISLDEAIHLKNAIDIADINKSSTITETETIPISNNITE